MATKILQKFQKFFLSDKNNAYLFILGCSPISMYEFIVVIFKFKHVLKAEQIHKIINYLNSGAKVFSHKLKRRLQTTLNKHFDNTFQKNLYPYQTIFQKNNIISFYSILTFFYLKGESLRIRMATKYDL